MAKVGSLDRTLRFILVGALLAAPLLLAKTFAPSGAWRFAVVAWGVVGLGITAFHVNPVANA